MVSLYRIGECGMSPVVGINRWRLRIASYRTRQKEHFAFSNHNVTKGSVILDNLEQHVTLDLVEPLLMHR
jgi:hypothetical protein